MNEEEKELINNIERALNLSEVKGDLVTIIYNYIVKATINLINKLQKELDKKDKVIDKMAKTIAGLQLYDFGRKEYFTLEDEYEVKEYFNKKVSE